MMMMNTHHGNADDIYITQWYQNHNEIKWNQLMTLTSMIRMTKKNDDGGIKRWWY